MRVFPQRGAPSEARPESLAEVRASAAGLLNVIQGTVDRGLADALPLIEELQRRADDGTAMNEMARLWLDNYRDFIAGAVHREPLPQWCPVCKVNHLGVVAEQTDVGLITRACPRVSTDDPRYFGGPVYTGDRG